MSDHPNIPSSNRLLSALSQGDREILYPRFESVDLSVKQDIEKPNASIEDVYFPEGCIISIVNKGGEDQVEVGMIGREGVTGLPILLGTDRSPNHTYVQVAGPALRIGADDFVLRWARATVFDRCFSAMSRRLCFR